MSRTRILALFWGAVLPGAAALSCSETTQPVINAFESAPELRAERALPDEKNFRALAKEVPGFAGYFYEPGTNNLIVNVTDLTRADLAHSKVDRLFSNPLKIGPAGRARVIVRSAKYSFVQLAGWRDSADLRFDPMRGVASLDLNEALNRLVVGVRNGDARRKVNAVMEALDVPLDAYVIQDNLVCSTDATESCFALETVVDPDAAEYQPGAALSLQSRIRPVQAGTQMTIVLLNPTRELACTIGFVGSNEHVLNGPALLTVGHCSKQFGFTGSQNYYQPATKWYGNVQQPFAHEVFDPAFEPCDSVTCRNSDVLVASTTDSVVNRIARPVGPPVPPQTNERGSTLIDVSNQFFPVIGIDDPVQGERLDKVGAYTGWTYGPTNITCENQWLDMIGTAQRRKLLCQTKGEYFSGGGDSGAPVFRYIPQTGSAVFLGIHWGHWTLSSGEFITSFFSNTSQIEIDVGISLW